MIKKGWSLLSLSAIPILLAGCDSENLDSMQEATSEIERIADDTVNELNKLAETETELQEQFNETLETDGELSTLKDESSPVFENIEKREDILNELKNITEDFQSQQDVLKSYEGELLDSSEIKDVNTAVDDFETNLMNYTESYNQSLTDEREFFSDISKDEATYQDFVDGIKSLNDKRENLNEPLMTLDNTLVTMDEQLKTLQSSIETELSEKE
ncbi:MAG: YkyA family protein [Alkalibacterium gilvum]|uniref:Putative cell-wall binding lipoprotein n=1 Tax=Alkalibacterium gilvum TaxID=1130080 RepID=A0A1H6SN08_9LACT|nr:YkyA family protein [Alkalibacterium gilvum]SEI69319.1 Putative cell-wall binding lipoprotein [Alkalibacterium gilvum]